MGVDLKIINNGGNIESWLDQKKNVGLAWDINYTGAEEPQRTQIKNPVN